MMTTIKASDYPIHVRCLGGCLSVPLWRYADERSAVVHAEAHVQRTGHDVDVVDVRCPYADVEECMTARERSAAGRSDHIPECPAHGLGTNPSALDDPGYDRICEACGLAYSAHPDEARHSCDGAE